MKVNTPFKIMETRAGIYIVDTPVTDEDILDKASDILLERAKTTRQVFSDPSASRDFLQRKIIDLEYETFAIIFLDNRHQLIAYEEMFRGTIDGASVYPREVVKRALELNAAALIVSHNHPSGIADPSQADIRITVRLKEALALVDIRLLDHLVIGSSDTKEGPGGIASLAELGHL